MKPLDLIKVVSNTTWGGGGLIERMYYVYTELDYGYIYRVWFCKTAVYKTIGYYSQPRIMIMFRIYIGDVFNHHQYIIYM